MAMAKHYTVIVVGSGPAGYTAGIYAARSGLNPLVIEGMELGGALMTTSEVENFPSYPTPILGPELMGRMRQQAQAIGVELLPDDAIEIDLHSVPKRIRTNGGEFTTDAIILAMGARTRYLGLDAESWALGNGLSTCATCDGFFFKDQRVVVVGGGDAAVEEAITLSRIAAHVTLVHRRENFRAKATLVDRLAKTTVQVRLNEIVESIGGDGKVADVGTRNVLTGERQVLPTNGLFVAIGQDPRSDLVRGQLDVSESGHVLVGTGTATSVDGVFACGDLVDHIYRQAVTSAGSGCQAALDCERWLVDKSIEPILRAG